jgi:threonine/homoserine/homoserine lactone efflux protein
MSATTLVGIVAVSVIVVAAPGPSVLFAVSRALLSGQRQALLVAAGNASGLFAQVLVVAAGLGVVVSGSDLGYSVLRWAGAAYLVWLGLGTIRHRSAAQAAVLGPEGGRPSTPLRDGFVVGLCNPKSLVFLAALLPQYVDGAPGSMILQTVLLGLVFCLVALIGDGAWVLAAVRARTWLKGEPRRLQVTAVVSGSTMISLGVLLAATPR